MYLDKTPYLLALEVEGAAGVLIIYRSTSPVGSKVQRFNGPLQTDVGEYMYLSGKCLHCTVPSDVLYKTRYLDESGT